MIVLEILLLLAALANLAHDRFARRSRRSLIWVLATGVQAYDALLDLPKPDPLKELERP